MPTSACSYTVLHIAGADATAFLHAQLSVDVQRLDTDRHALAAWCDAKGRVLCSGRLVTHDDGYLWIVPATMAAATSRRLRMYVLRAKVDIADVGNQWSIRGLTTADMATLPANGALSRRDDRLILGIDTGNGPGALALRATAQDATGLAAADNAWQLLEIDAGLPEVRAATSGLFVPQMLNLHWLDGVDFNKGCYPGQEIVARLQYRGQLKRRVFRLRWRGKQPQAGADIVDASGQKQGTILRSAVADNGSGRLLAVVRVAASNQPLVTADAQLELLSLPYATDDPS